MSSSNVPSYRRALRYLDTLYSVQGVFDTNRFYDDIQNETVMRELYDKLGTRDADFGFDDFMMEAERLWYKHDTSTDFEYKTPEGLMKGVKNHRGFKKMSCHDIEKRKNEYENAKVFSFDIDYSKYPAKQTLDVNLSANLNRASPRYVVSCHGCTRKTTFEVPKNVMILFMGSMGMLVEMYRLYHIIEAMKTPEIVDQLFTNPLWSRNPGKDHALFRNRYYVPPGSVIYDMGMRFADESSKVGLFEIQDAIPENFEFYSNVEDPLDLMPVYFPDFSVPRTMSLQNFTERLSEKGGGIVMILSCRSYKNSRVCFGTARREEKRLFAERRFDTNSMMKDDIGTFHLKTKTPVIRDTRTSKDISVQVVYMEDLLAWYHLGKRTSKRFWDWTHRDAWTDNNGTLHFTRERNGVVQKIMTRLDGLPFPNGKRKRDQNVSDSSNTNDNDTLYFF